MSKLVLIVEDDENNAQMFSDLIEREGHETVCVENGWDALKIAFNRSPDLIIMDIQLPDISGIKTSKMLKASNQFKDVPIIAATAFPKEWTEEKCLEVGCDVFMTKPISIPKFLEAVAKYIG